MREKKYSNFSVEKENSEIWKLRKEQKLKRKLQSNITTVLNLMTVLKCAFPACHRSLKKVPFCLSSRAESALLTCCHTLRVPFFSNLTMPFFRAGGNTMRAVADLERVQVVCWYPLWIQIISYSWGDFKRYCVKGKQTPLFYIRTPSSEILDPPLEWYNNMLLYI